MRDQHLRPLRVAIVAPSLRILGGQSVQAERLLRGWSTDPEIAARLVPTNPLPPGFLRVAVRLKYLRTIVTQATFWPLLVRELWWADVVHAFSASYSSFVLSTLPAILIGRLLRRPVIVHYHSGEAPDHLRRSWVARYALAKLTDAVAVPSPFLRDVFAAFGLRTQVVPNTVDFDRFVFRPRHTLSPRLVSTRNFEAHYNVACTLRAFAIVEQEYPNASLTLVGGGTHEGALRGLARELKLQNVTFTGRVPADEISRYYADADIYVQTPDIDNMPLSVLEAYASGVSVVSTDAGGVPSILTHGVHGLLAPRGDHRAVADRIIELLRQPARARQLAANAHTSCSHYSWSAVRPQWLALYRELATPAALPAPTTA